MVITGAGVSPGPMSKIRVWCCFFVPSMWRITSKAIREHPGFALRAETEAIQSTTFPKSSKTSGSSHTDAFTKAWDPAEKPLMTVILTFEDNGGAFWGPR